ncbi:MAG: septum formation initiator family protein [Chthoniobacterales bacterium]
MQTAHARAQLRKRRETDFWRAVNTFLMFMVGAAAVVATVLWFLPELRRIDEMRANLAGLEKELAGQQLLLAQQQRQEGWLNENPEYVEMIARDRLDLMKGGETVVRLDEKSVTSDK